MNPKTEIDLIRRLLYLRESNNFRLISYLIEGFHQLRSADISAAVKIIGYTLDDYYEDRNFHTPVEFEQFVSIISSSKLFNDSYSLKFHALCVSIYYFHQTNEPTDFQYFNRQNNHERRVWFVSEIQSESYFEYIQSFN